MPFRLQVKLAEVVAHRAWRHAHAAVLDAVERGESVALLGAPGTGKTMLLRAVAQALEALGWRVALPGAEGLAGVPEEAGVVLLDEAGQLSPEELAALARQDRTFVLAAAPGFAARLSALGRPVAQVALGRMAPEEVARLVPARLAAAGRPPDMFTPEALAALARLSGGVVRLVLVLAGAALFAAESTGATRVTQEDVDEAAAMRVALAEPEEEAAPAAPSPPLRPVPASVPPPLPRQRLAGTGRPRPSRARVWWRRMTLGLAAAGLAMAAGAVVVVPQLMQRRTPPPSPPAPVALAPPAAQAPEVVPPPEPPAPELPPAPAPAPAEPARMAEPEPPPVMAAPPVPVPVPPAAAPAPRPAPRPRVAAPAPPSPAPVVVPLPETAVAPSPWSVGRPAPAVEEAARFERVVTREPANIRRAPGIASPVVRVTSAGMVLRVFEQRGPWVQVGDSAPWGWVHAAVVDRAS